MTTLSHRASHATNAAALALTLCLAAGSTHAAAQVGVQVSVHQPGFHGRVVIGDQPPPAVIYQQPVIVQQSPVAVVQQPIYMNVPPSHYQHWARHCGYWRACGQPVYFVRPEVVYRDNGRHRGWREERREDRREWREERRDERHDDRRDDRGGDRHHGHGRD